MTDRFVKRLRKRARKRMRGWPVATLAYYSPNLTRATKVAVGIVPNEHTEPVEMRTWSLEVGDVRSDPAIAEEILMFVERHGARSIAMADGIMGCPHEEGIDYEGQWCPMCEFWHGRDRFAGERIH